MGDCLIARLLATAALFGFAGIEAFVESNVNRCTGFRTRLGNRVVARSRIVTPRLQKM